MNYAGKWYSNLFGKPNDYTFVMRSGFFSSGKAIMTHLTIGPRHNLTGGTTVAAEVGLRSPLRPFEFEKQVHLLIREIFYHRKEVDSIVHSEFRDNV